PKAIESIIAAFLRRGGSTLQLNLLDTQQLIEAKKHPEKHPNLIVRICGYSRAFNTLDPESQDEVINRAMRQL
ncbi:MAG: glycine radical domain-containing protein, partial [Alphaproteobacteria bacterium]